MYAVGEGGRGRGEGGARVSRCCPLWGFSARTGRVDARGDVQQDGLQRGRYLFRLEEVQLKHKARLAMLAVAAGRGMVGRGRSGCDVLRIDRCGKQGPSTWHLPSLAKDEAQGICSRLDKVRILVHEARPGRAASRGRKQTKGMMVAGHGAAVMVLT